MRNSLNPEHRWCVILSGGDGTRLQPLTRLLAGDDRPKQFCRLLGEETLLAQTRHRVAKILPEDRTLHVLTKAHECFYEAALATVPPRRMVVQPSNRGTLPAILWALMRLVRLDQQAVVAFFPSDHYFANEEMFTAEVLFAFESAEAASGVVLLGAAATAPEVEYGWIEPEPMKSGSRLLGVRRFWEKPGREVAQTLLDKGCFWNTFIMIGRAPAFLALIQSAAPGLYDIFQIALTNGELDLNAEAMAKVYEQIETADFSKCVLTGSVDRLAVLSLGEVGWNDLGDPRRVSAILSQARPRKPVGQAVVSEVLASVSAAG